MVYEVRTGQSPQRTNPVAIIMVHVSLRVHTAKPEGGDERVRPGFESRLPADLLARQPLAAEERDHASTLQLKGRDAVGADRDIRQAAIAGGFRLEAHAVAPGG